MTASWPAGICITAALQRIAQLCSKFSLSSVIDIQKHRLAFRFTAALTILPFMQSERIYLLNSRQTAKHGTEQGTPCIGEEEPRAHCTNEQDHPGNGQSGLCSGCTGTWRFQWPPNMSLAIRSEQALHVHGSAALCNTACQTSTWVSALQSCYAGMSSAEVMIRFNNRLIAAPGRALASAALDCGSSAECLLSN